MKKFRVSYANVVSTAALVLSLGRAIRGDDSCASLGGDRATQT
jgi:hypothetical protein